MLIGNIMGSSIGEHHVETAEAIISHRECERGMCDVRTSDSTSELGIYPLKIVLQAENAAVT